MKKHASKHKKQDHMRSKRIKSMSCNTLTWQIISSKQVPVPTRIIEIQYSLINILILNKQQQPKEAKWYHPPLS
jgi:hypothetical protein